MEATDQNSAWIPPAIPIKRRLLNAVSYMIGALVAFVVMDRFLIQLSEMGRLCVLSLLMGGVGVSVGYELFWLGNPLRFINSASAPPDRGRRSDPKDNAQPGIFTASALSLPVTVVIGLTCLEYMVFPYSLYVAGILNFLASCAIGGWVSRVAYKRLLKRAHQYPFPQPIPAPDTAVPDRTWKSLIVIGVMLWLMGIAGLIAFILSK